MRLHKVTRGSGDASISAAFCLVYQLTPLALPIPRSKMELAPGNCIAILKGPEQCRDVGLIEVYEVN